jgi:hypothetical protein
MSTQIDEVVDLNLLFSVFTDKEINALKTRARMQGNTYAAKLFSSEEMSRHSQSGISND